MDDYFATLNFPGSRFRIRFRDIETAELWGPRPIVIERVKT